MVAGQVCELEVPFAGLVAPILPVDEDRGGDRQQVAGYKLAEVLGVVTVVGMVGFNGLPDPLQALVRQAAKIHMVGKVIGPEYQKREGKEGDQAGCPESPRQAKHKPEPASHSRSQQRHEE